MLLLLYLLLNIAALVAIKWLDSTCMKNVPDAEIKGWDLMPVLLDVQFVKYVMAFKERCWPHHSTRYVRTKKLDY